MNASMTITVVAMGLTAFGVAILCYRRRAATCSMHSKLASAAATVVACASLALAMGLAVFSWCCLPHEVPRTAGVGQDPSPSGVDDPSKAKDIVGSDELLQRQIVGVWTDHYQGRRTMTLQNDGTGTIDVELAGAMATLFGERLRFDILWRIENGQLIRDCTGGRPTEKVTLILKAMGSRAEEPVLELTEDHLRTSNPDQTTVYNWQRVR